MPKMEAHTYARQLWELHGSKAIPDAAQKARDFEKKGKKEEADYWRRVETILLQMRGPKQS